MCSCLYDKVTDTQTLSGTLLIVSYFHKAFGEVGLVKAERSIPSFESEVILVTSSNTGLGKQCALEFALRGRTRIFITARNMTACRAAVEDVKKHSPKPVEVTLL